MANQLTEVRLLAVPLENDYKHTLYFADTTSQYSYFVGKTKFYETKLSYQRKDGYIRFPAHFDDLAGCNYLMYRNEDTSNKWYYAFITKMEYKGEETTWIYFETDVIQTYLFDYEIKPSFVEREHVDDDTAGLHTVPENLEMGEYVVTHNSNVSELQDMFIVIGATEYENASGYVKGGGRYNGLYSGLSYFLYDYDDVSGINRFIESYDEDGHSEAIQCMFIAPRFVCGSGADDPTYGVFMVESETPATFSHTLNKSVMFGYIPKNKKLNCYPYKYLLVSNNNGASSIYQYEHFSSNTMSFTIDGVLTPGCSIRMSPNNYKGVDKNIEEGLNLGKYPICNWTSDVFTNWLTQNGMNIAVDVVSGLGQMAIGGVASVASGGAGAVMGVSMMLSGGTQIGHTMSQVHQMSFSPPQAKGNTNCGDVISATGNCTFTFYGMSIKEEYMKIIDGYFDMFGYKVNSVKVPNTNHRANYWYTKTIDVSIDMKKDKLLHSEDMQKIKNVYNNGVTFWKNPDNIGDYSVSNSII